MTLAIESSVLLTVRGTLVPADHQSARVLHNETAGSEAGIAAARSLGDLSHKVYVPCAAAGEMSAPKNELLFVDTWEGAEGLQQFFSNPHVQEQGGRLFSRRDPTVWMPARGSFSFDLPTSALRTNRYVGVIRVAVKSPQAAIEAFATNGKKHLRDARKRGQLSHEIFFKLAPPAEGAPVEMLGIDVWADLDGMMAHYRETMAGLASAFAGKPDGTVWQQAEGGWSEW